MLLQFSVENFKSFKDRAVLSLEASPDKELNENLVTEGKNRILKVVSIFGANASGKSNLFSALTAAILLIRLSNNRVPDEKLSLIVPFEFDTESKNKPSVFEFVFLVNKKKYVYRFSANKDRILTECLYQYKTAKPSVIFERDADSENEYHFTDANIRKELKPIIERNMENKLFLATAATWNSKFAKEPFLWFQNSINTYLTKVNDLLPVSGPLFESDENHSLRKFVISLLREADINIASFSFITKEITNEQLAQQIPVHMRRILSALPTHKHKHLEIKTVHRVINKDNKYDEYISPFEWESLGTQNLFMFSPIIKRAFETGETLCVDEIDASLHPLLLLHLIDLFNNPELNKGNAQLIVSAHATELLSERLLRRDQIYFIDKDRYSAVSKIYSLDEFEILNKKDKDLRKAYLLGRYGGIPNISEGVLD